MAPARTRSADNATTPSTAVSAEPSKTSETTKRGGEPEQGGSRRTGTINLPFVTAEFHRTQLRLPTWRLPAPRGLGTTAGSAVAKARSLSPAELTYYAGLAGLAALELVEWPVALAVGAGTALARAGTTRATEHSGEQTAAHKTGQTASGGETSSRGEKGQASRLG